VIEGVWGVEWTELTPFNYGALFMFGAGFDRKRPPGR